MRLKRKHMGEPILILSELDKRLSEFDKQEGRYPRGHLLVLSYFDKNSFGVYQLGPKSSKAYATLKNKTLIGESVSIFPYDKKRDEIFVGLLKIAEGIEKIIDQETGKPIQREVMEEIGRWYGKTFV